MIKKKIIYIFIILFLTGCATVYNPATQRQEFVLIGTKNEVSLGKSLSGQINRDNEISSDPFLNERLKGIGQEIAMASDRDELEYHFFIIENDDLNAFALPGGYIYVHKAVLNEASDDELACVLAHEIGHVAARHSAKRLETVLGYQIVMSLAFGKSSSVDLYRAINVVFNVVSLGYSREDERLADRLAVKYSYKAGYDPQAMVSFFNKLKLQAGKRGQDYNLVFLSSHPPIEERIDNVKNEIERLKNTNGPN
ncbi:MAG: M48 family metallopeptidase [Candidatus Omnitrophota bacterium]